MSGHHHHSYFDPYARGDSPVHHAPAALKLFVAIALIVGVVITPVRASTLLTFFPAVLIGLVAVSGMSFVSPGFLIKRLAMMEPVVLGAAVMVLFQPDGLRIFLALSLRTTLCLAIALLLANTTAFAEILIVLRRARLPRILVTTMALMYRYLFVLTEEAQRMQRARASRTFTHDRLAAWRILATTLGQLFVRTTSRAERIYLAMCARGWR